MEVPGNFKKSNAADVGWWAGSGSSGGKKTSELLEVYKKKLKWWERKKNRKLYIGMDIFLFGDKMVKIELEEGEEVVERIVTKFGRIEGMKR